MAEFLIYTQPGCSYCDAARALLSQLGHTWADRCISLTENRQEMLARVPNVRTVPQIFIGDYRIGGFDDLKRLVDGGMFDVIVEANS